MGRLVDGCEVLVDLGGGVGGTNGGTIVRVACQVPDPRKE